MLAHGDELGRTQGGNNNVYAQDNEIAWVDWDLDKDQQDLLAYTSAAIALRKAHPVLRRRRFFGGDPKHGGESALGDIEWLKPNASLMDDQDWSTGYARSVMVFLNGDAIPESDDMGRRISDDHFLLMFNASGDPIDFTLPVPSFGDHWRVRLDAGTGEVDPVDEIWDAKTTHSVPSHSMVVLSTAVVPPEEREAASSRAEKAIAVVAKISENPPGSKARGKA